MCIRDRYKALKNATLPSKNFLYDEIEKGWQRGSDSNVKREMVTKKVRKQSVVREEKDKTRDRKKG